MLTSSHTKRLLGLMCILVTLSRFAIKPCSVPRPSQLFQGNATPAAAHTPTRSHTSIFVQDFYKFYSRNLESSVWGTELPDDSNIPRSGLGIFMILWTQDDETGRSKLKRCLQSLDVFFNDRFDYPVLILHEDLPQGTMETIRTWTRSRIEFVGHSLIDSEYAKIFERTGLNKFNWYPEYLHMIRTNVYRWPLHRALFGYRYVFKLDADAALVESVDFDIFEHLRDRDLMGAYVTAVMDHGYVCENLYETAEDILRYNRLEPVQDLYRKPKLWTWYGFAFVFDTAFARSPAYLNAVWHFDNVHGVFQHRWGDPHLYLLTSMFLEPNQTAQLPVPLQHQAHCEHVKNERSCSPDAPPLAWSTSSKSLPNLQSASWTWDPSRPFEWSSAFWPNTVLSKPPYCLSNHGCSA